MSRVLAVSPHLDDAAFSCGAALARWARAGHEVVVLTVFTATVPDPAGFALRCQTDKGLPPEADYMALRREEDRRAMAVLGAAAVHLPVEEAPHRGYDDARALRRQPHPDDDAPPRVAAALADALDRLAPSYVLGPAGVGGHVDHLIVADALAALAPHATRWIDQPYALREGPPPPDPSERTLPLGAGRAAKLDACACYATQLDFQFGGERAMRVLLGGARERLRGATPETDVTPRVH